MRASLTCRHPQAPLYFTRITPDSSAINATKRGTKSDYLPFSVKFEQIRLICKIQKFTYTRLREPAT